MNFTKKGIYIGLFAILYLIVAFSSLYHAVEFFGLANNSWMAIILAFAFEIGQAAVLFALLTSNKDRGKVMPWVLMTMFTLVQVLGNVYSSYKHIINNSTENLRYFKEPIFIWTQLPDDQATVIITYLVGGLLPISALLLTSMVTNYLTEDQKPNYLTEDQKPNNLIEDQKTNDLIKDQQSVIEDKKIETTEDETEKDNNNDKKKDNEETDGNIDSPKEEVIVEDEKEPEKEIEIPNDIKGTDPDGGVIGEQGEDGLKVLKESLNSKDNEIEKLKQELEELKHPKITQIPVNEIIHSKPMEEPEGLKQLKKETNEKEQPKRESHFINL